MKSHVVEHTNFVSSWAIGILMSASMVVHGLSHVAHAGFAHGLGVVLWHSSRCRGHAGGCGWSWQVGSRLTGGRGLSAAVNLGHTTDSAASKAGVLVAVTPAVHSSLDEASLSAKRRVELSKSPSDAVAVGLVNEAITAVLVLCAARARIHAVLLLEFLRQVVCVHRLDITPYSVLHLNAVARVLESDPLHSIAVLSYDERSRGRDRSGGSVRVVDAAWTLAAGAV
jgi:hypothetical protein